MTKKIVLGSIAFFIIAIGIAAFMIFRKPDDSTKTPSSFQSPSYFPFATSTSSTAANGQDDTFSFGTSTPTIGKQNNLVQITSEPVSGVVLFQKASTTVARYVERATSHVLDANFETELITRASNTTLPRVYEALWAGGTRVLLRYLNESQTTIRTLYATLATTTSGTNSNADLDSVYLADNIESIAFSPDGTKIFYLIETAEGSEGIVANADGSGRSVIFSSPANEWVASWPEKNTIALQTKASGQADGLLYFITPKGAQKKILSGVPGMVANVSPDAKYVAFTDLNGLLQILDVKAGRSSYEDLYTIAYKCVWSRKQTGVVYCAIPTEMPSALYPDAWYQGIIPFNDTIYRIDTVNRIQSIASQPPSRGYVIDAINLALSPDERILVYSSKQNLSLWAALLPVTPALKAPAKTSTR